MTGGASIHIPGNEPLQNPEEGPNASWYIHYNGDGKPDYVEKTIGEITYRKTITWSGDKVTNVSAWIEQ